MDNEHNSRLPTPSVNQARRRLSMAGLAAPAVMGMLASRPVLGAVPYQCTISGQISGNASVTGSAADCKLGVSFQTWLSSLASNRDPGNKSLTELNSAFQDVYYYDNVQGTKQIIAKPFSPSGNQRKATLYEILTLPVGFPAPPELAYGLKALLIWFNAKTYFPASYPLNESDAVSLFNALVTGGNFSGTTGAGSFVWGPAEIKLYIDLLYH